MFVDFKRILCYLPNVDGKFIRPGEATAANRAYKWPFAGVFPEIRHFYFNRVSPHFVKFNFIDWSTQTSYESLNRSTEDILCRIHCKNWSSAQCVGECVRPNCFVMCMLGRRSDIKTSFYFRLAMGSMKCFDCRSHRRDDSSYGF